MARAEAMAPARRWDQAYALITGPLGAGLAAAVIAWCLYVFGPPGGDAATHLYQEHLFRQNGLQFWDNLWYSGRYSLINYTLLYYPLAVLLTPAVVVAASIGAATAAFARLTRTAFGAIATPAIVAATVVFPLQVVAGVYPFALGLALGLAMLVALQARRIWLASGLAVLALAAHVLAFGFVGLVLVAWAIADRSWVADRRYRAFVGVLVVLATVQLLTIRAFSLPGGRYMFDPKDLAAILVFSAAGVALSYGVPAQRPVGVFFGLYGVVALADYAIPNPVGGNIVRLMATMGLPLLLIPLAARGFRPRQLAIFVVVLIAAWQAISPVTEWTASAAAPGQHAAYWAPALAFLDAHSSPDYRVEVVQSKRYWEAYYIAGRGFAMARGWYRQDDYPGNATLYNHPTPQSYQAWLRSVGVRYVLLADATLDPSSGDEATLLRSGASGLVPVGRDGPWTIYGLPAPTPIITPAASAVVSQITPTTMTFAVRRPGALTVRVHDTPYWTVSSSAGAGTSCVATGTGAVTTIVATRPGTLRLRFAVHPSSVLRAILGESTGCPGTAVP
jgi:hypothetical protein